MQVEKSYEEKVQDAKERKDLYWFFTSYNGEDLPQIIDELIQSGETVEDCGGSTALIRLCQYYRNDNLIAIAESLIGASKDPTNYVNAKNAYGETALSKLCENYSQDNLLDVVKLLVENGADVNVTYLSGWTPLILLCRNYNKSNLKEIVQYLIEKGVKVNASRSNGSTPLLELCDPRHSEARIDVIRLLMDYINYDRVGSQGIQLNDSYLCYLIIYLNSDLC